MGVLSSKEGEPKDAKDSPCSSCGFRFTRRDRIRRSEDYREIMVKGRKIRTPHFVVRWRVNTVGVRRLGISVSKRVGNSCARNRVKRRLREYFRHNRHKLPNCMDLVIIAGQGSSILETSEIFKELDRAMTQGFF